jgi:CRISPR-associated protein Cmr1
MSFNVGVAGVSQMQILQYQLVFHTPAFLGNAEQSAQWRTPPVKALLRQWWRVVFAAEHGHRLQIAALREAEGQLFGMAADGRSSSRQSQLRLRLDKWSAGGLKSWDGLEQPAVHHPEVQKKVGPHLYLGYGPLTFAAGRTVLTENRAAIQAGDSATLSLAVPAGEHGRRVQRALALMNLYGTLGGRSRNGWGSFTLRPQGDTPALPLTLDPDLLLPWREALASDWPQAIGSDSGGRPLIWRTNPEPDWPRLMRRLAEVKIGLRTHEYFRFTTGPDAAQAEPRHWLSYPVSKNHTVRDWGGKARLPNTLRFKVRPAAHGKGLHGVIFHVPCLPPPAFKPDPHRQTIEKVWQQVHAHLDADPALQRIDA